MLLVAAMTMAGGCALTPEAKKARHIQRAERYFDQEKFREAVLEYRNVLKYERDHARAIERLGLAHFELGEMGQAFPYLAKAREAAPANLDVRLKLSAVYVLMRQRDKARAEAVFVLDKQPRNFEALVVMAEAAETQEELDEAIERVADAGTGSVEAEKLNRVLGTLYMRKPDLPKAERAFKAALEANPDSSEAHLALGRLYLGKKELAEAEREFKAGADASPPGSAARLSLAEFYLKTGRRDEGQRVLLDMTQQASDFVPGWLALAEVAFDDRRYDDALASTEQVLKRNSSQPLALLLKGRVHLAKRETDQAIERFHKVLKLNPRFAEARYRLAQAYLQARNVHQARAELQQAVTTAPDFTEAVLALAELNMQAGAVEPAIEALEALVAQQPQVARAHELLGFAYLRQRRADRALDAYGRRKELAPKDPRGSFLVGLGLRAQGRREEARQQFEAALAAAPGYPEPLMHLVAMALEDKKPEAAVARVQKQIAVEPKSGDLHFLLGRVQHSRGNLTAAEASYRRALELAPGLLGAYATLGHLYGTTGKNDDALDTLQKALAVNPEDVVVLMLTGIAYEQKGDFSNAKQAYRKVLDVGGGFAPAANNLAWLYSEHGGDPEEALQLAQSARQAEPADPHISDTLGWIYYKRGLYRRAVALLEDSAQKLPDSAVIHYHLGMTYYRLADNEAARQALSRALALDGAFRGAEEARRVLSTLPSSIRG